MAEDMPRCVTCNFRGRVFAIVVRQGQAWIGICPHCTLKHGREAVKQARNTTGGVASAVIDFPMPEIEPAERTRGIILASS